MIKRHNHSARGLLFAVAKDVGESPAWSPVTGAPNRGGVGYNLPFLTRNGAR